MKIENLKKRFQKMKADFDVSINPIETRNNSFRRNTNGYLIDVENGVFSITGTNNTIDINIIDQDVKDRHILLNIGRKEETKGGFEVINEKWLCGHDERDWFVGAIQGSVKNIWDAKQSLKPKEIVEAEKGVRQKSKQRRKNKVRIRQGEWFFLPRPNLIVPDVLIHKDEPISRNSRSKPHIVEEVYRTGGKSVWVKNGNIVSNKEYELSNNKSLFQQRVADATVYGRGYVKHKDHATIYLDGWHQIFMNSERASSNLAFLD